MSSTDDDSVDVKMLADHLVQVKNQYEGSNYFNFAYGIERLNLLNEKLKENEKEKSQLEYEYKQMERELNQKRNEIFNMKRANVAQHAIEERENWNAMLIQQKNENKRLQNGEINEVVVIL